MEFHSVVNLRDHRTARGATENDMWSARHIQHFWFLLVQSELPSIGHQYSRLNIYSCHSAVQNTVTRWDDFSWTFFFSACASYTLNICFFHRHLQSIISNEHRNPGVTGGVLGVRVRFIVNVRFLFFLTAIVASHWFLHQLYNVTIEECECDYLPRRWQLHYQRLHMHQWQREP